MLYALCGIIVALIVICALSVLFDETIPSPIPPPRRLVPYGPHQQVYVLVRPAAQMEAWIAQIEAEMNAIPEKETTP